MVPRGVAALNTQLELTVHKEPGTQQPKFPSSKHGPLDSKIKRDKQKQCSKRERPYNMTSFTLPNRECSKLFGEDGMTLKLFVKRTAPFSILWTLTNYLYLLALKKLTATDVSALYCCHKAFVFLLSWIVLKDRFMGVRVCLKTAYYFFKGNFSYF